MSRLLSNATDSGHRFVALTQLDLFILYDTLSFTVHSVTLLEPFFKQPHILAHILIITTKLNDVDPKRTMTLMIVTEAKVTVRWHEDGERSSK